MEGDQPHVHASVEQEVLAALTTDPLTTAQVVAAIPRRLAYTTVATTLSRLHAKGALERISIGRAYAYRLPGPRDAVRNYVAARSMTRVLDLEDDRGTVLARFLADLGPEDEAVLSELLRAKADERSRGSLEPGAHPGPYEGDQTDDQRG